MLFAAHYKSTETGQDLDEIFGAGRYRRNVLIYTSVNKKKKTLINNNDNKVTVNRIRSRRNSRKMVVRVGTFQRRILISLLESSGHKETVYQMTQN